jgi:hypothetical protein
MELAAEKSSRVAIGNTASDRFPDCYVSDDPSICPVLSLSLSLSLTE